VAIGTGIVISAGTGSAAGYIVAVLTHIGSDLEAVRTSGAKLARDPAASYRLQVDRTKDVEYLLNALDEIEREVPQLRGRIDRTRIGVAGHSVGAGTTLLLAGAKPAPPGGEMHVFADSRIIAAVAISPQGPRGRGIRCRILEQPADTRDDFEWNSR
jgi:predicted dienelactone hydrolase